MANKNHATYQSGPKKGKLKPGFRYGKNGRIIQAKKAKKRRHTSPAKKIEKKFLSFFK
ncbi:hypothetical protein [Celerinatantimonas sp. MCCC 1A17872]|uniref:hypothetical protein n=1 Tax=Celerinatantimonas sp. MCCC 1A17872 TaxID=3177514 RepID=UPI0038CA9629